MRERGMIFNAEMVRAILNGSKTQTRRPIKAQPVLTENSGFSWKGYVYGSGISDRETNRNFAHIACPCGKPGDRIWVREAFGDAGVRLTYRADTDDGAHCKVKRWTPSIHMPRWASRILLEITAVRVERLNAISDKDAQAEGLERYNDDGIVYYGPYGRGDCRPERAFSELWQSIYGESSWQANPWVWVIEFKRVEAGNEQ